MGILAVAHGLRRGLLLAFLPAVVAAPVHAGDFRVVLEAEGDVRNDGNYAQIQRPDGLEDQGEAEVARTGFNLRLSYELPRWLLALDYFPTYEWVLDNSEINGTTHRLDLGLTGNLTRRLEMRVRERLLSSPNLDLYSAFEEAEPIAVARRGDQLTHSLDLGFAQELSRRSVLLFGATHTLRTFDSEDFSDTETLAARLGVGFELAEDRRFDLLATAGSYDFGARRLLLDDEVLAQGEGETDVQTLGAVWQQPFFRDGRFRVEAGMFAVESTDLEDTGWRGALELSRELELLGWSLGLRHDVSAGVGLGRPTVVDSAFAGASMNVGRRLVLGLDGSFSRHDDLEDDSGVDLPLAPESRILESAAGTLRASWSFGAIARLHGGYSRIWQESRSAPFPDLSYSRYFLGLALQLYRSGEEPQDPARQEEPEEEPEDDEPDAQ